MKKILLILFLVLVSGCEMSKELCENAGGKWNECGSACTGTEAEFCIEVCVKQCECNEEYKCPNNYKCKITENDEFGVCVNE